MSEKSISKKDSKLFETIKMRDFSDEMKEDYEEILRNSGLEYVFTKQNRKWVLMMARKDVWKWFTEFCAVCEKHHLEKRKGVSTEKNEGDPLQKLKCPKDIWKFVDGYGNGVDVSPAKFLVAAIIAYLFEGCNQEEWNIKSVIRLLQMEGSYSGADTEDEGVLFTMFRLHALENKNSIAVRYYDVYRLSVSDGENNIVPFCIEKLLPYVKYQLGGEIIGGLSSLEG